MPAPGEWGSACGPGCGYCGACTSGRGDDVDTGDLWKEHRRAQQDRREARLVPRSDEIRALTGKGFTVRELSAYHFRVDGKLDLFPIHRRFHFITANQRGGYRDPVDVAMRFLRAGK